MEFDKHSVAPRAASLTEKAIVDLLEATNGLQDHVEVSSLQVEIKMLRNDRMVAHASCKLNARVSN